MKLSPPSPSPRLPCPPDCRQAGGRGFTLVELLAVVAIIAIMAALISPLLNRAIGSANSVKCVSNLKQIGTGMSLFAGDHDGHLPGPLSGAQYAMYFAYAPGNGRLSMQLQGYISPDIPSGGGTMLSPTFLCPAFANVIKMPNTQAQPYVMNNATINGVSPFGSGAGTTNYVGGAALGAISSGTTPLHKVWAMQDLDDDLVASFGDAPAHPVHPTYNAAPHAAGTTAIKQAHPGGYRNALFLDFHVGRMSLDGTTPL